MSTTVTSYSVGLTMDANKYIKNANLSRAETAKLTRQINSARSPVEEYARTYDLLENAFTKQAISLETYQRLLAQAQQKRDRLTKTEQAAAPAIEKTTTLTQQLSGKLKTLAAGYLSLAAAQRVMSSIRQEFLDVDEIAKSSRAIGENFNQMQRYRFAVAEFTGIDGPAATTMLTKLTQRVGEASLGIGEAGENFRKLGIDVQAMAAASPVEQFEMLSEAIRKIENPTEQVAMATKFFEESGARLLPLLRATQKEYEASAGQIDRLGLSMSDLEVANVEATNDAIGRLEASLSGLARQAAAIPHVAESIDALAVAATQLDKVANATLNFGVGQVKDFANDKAMSQYAEKTKEVREHFEAIEKTKQRMLRQQAAVTAAAEAEAAAQAKAAAEEKARKDKEEIDKQANFEADYSGQIEALQQQLELSQAIAKQQSLFASGDLAAGFDQGDVIADLERQQKIRQMMNDGATEAQAKALLSLQEQIDMTAQLAKREEDKQRAAEQAAKEQARMSQDALAAARRHFDMEVQRQQKMQQDMVSQFSAVEVGSAEDVRMQAEAINRQIAPAVDTADPTEDQILAEAKKQYNALVESNTKAEKQQETMDAMLEELKNNGFKRFR